MCFVYSLPERFAHFFEMLKLYIWSQGCKENFLPSELAFYFEIFKQDLDTDVDYLFAPR